jgi:biotin synthase
MVRTARKLGLRVCSGGIFGLGESESDRVSLAFELRELGVDSIPINFLNPIPGTPLQDADNLTPETCLRIIAMFRLVLPERDIVVCGGRERNLGDLHPLVFWAGANGVLTGDYLTTTGRDTAADLKMIAALGLKPYDEHCS